MCLEAVIEALRFQGADATALQQITENEWHKLLPLTDRTQLTLPLAVHCLPQLPPIIQTRLTASLAGNSERHRRIAYAYAEIAAALTAQGIEFLVLKGMTQWPFYTGDLNHRPQYDIDLLCDPSQAGAAKEILGTLGYEPVTGNEQVPVDHLPTLIRRTGWQWRGDYYDPEMPASVEIHFRLWDPATEGFDVEGIEDFWARRTTRETPIGTLPSLNRADTLAYCCLHLLRHLLRGDLKLYHAYEIGRFLHLTADDDAFWATWRQSHPPSMRRLQAIVFRLAQQWFRCGTAAPAQAEIDALPARVQTWFELFAMSPVQALSRPNKDELWLHLELVCDSHAARSVLARRLLPRRPPRIHFNPHVSDAPSGLRRRISSALYRSGFVIARTLHHLRSVAPVLLSAIKWHRSLNPKRDSPGSRPGIPPKRRTS